MREPGILATLSKKLDYSEATGQLGLESQRPRL